MKQDTFTDIEYSFRKKKTKREEFLEIMDEIIPWDEWVGVIELYYPKGKRGRPPMGIEKMLRMYLLQIWFNLSDPATEDAIYDSYAMRKFTGIDFMTEAVPDETTLVTPMVRRSKSRMDSPNWTQRRRNRGVVICRSVGRSFLDSTSVCTFSPHSSIIWGRIW